MNKPELKPCPFCGGEAIVLHWDGTDTFSVGCVNTFVCHGGTHTSRAYQSEQEAAEAWNRRAELNAANKWISVDKRVPETNEPVLVWYEYFRYGRYNRMYQTYGIARYFSEVRKWLIEGCNTSTDKVLYWCPLQPPMKIEEPPDDKEEEEVLDE